MSRVAHSIKDKARTDDIQITESVDFGSLLLSDNVLNGLKNSGFVRPSPIQLKAIPLGRCGLDLIVQAKSGTGKTCVFSVIALESIVTDTASTQVLVLAPTREIAVQIWEVINSIGSATSQLECHTFIGGLPLHEDRIKLKKCHIAVGTPGRIKQLIEGGVLRTDSLRLFVLDEADKLLEESFQEQINWIYSTLPENKQMLALSATYPEYLADHLTAYMRNPTFLRLNISDPALLGIRQYYKTVTYHPLSHVMFEEKSKEVVNILSSVSFQQCLVFSNLQTRAKTLADSLSRQGWPTACIAGCLDQKDRNYAMARLKTYKCRILISTDLTSRGIDADKVNMVINLDIPKDHETYLHRIGRAGRFGSFGIAISLVGEGQEKLNLDAIEKQCNTQIYPLPDPLPSDLAKPGNPIFLDDVVSSEVINTDKSSSSSIKSELRSPSKSSLHTNSDKEDRNMQGEVKSSDDASSSEGERNKDKVKAKKQSLPKLEAKEYLFPMSETKEHLFHGFELENADTSLTRTKDVLDLNNLDSLDNVDSLKKNQKTEGRTAVSYEDVEYLEIDENLQVNVKTDIDPSTRTSMCLLTTDKITSFSGNDISKKSYSKNFSKGKTKEKKPFLNIERNESDTKLTKESLMKVNVDSLTESDSSLSHSEKAYKTNDMIQSSKEEKIIGIKTEQRTETRTLPSFNNCKLSVTSFEKVNICTIFRNSTDYKPLSKSHSYNAAKDSLKMFRKKSDVDTKAVHTRENCSLPVIKNDLKECGILKSAIIQVQDMLENRLNLHSDINTVETPEVKIEKASEVDSISSENEFEAKEEVLRKINSSSAAIQLVDDSNEAQKVSRNALIDDTNKAKEFSNCAEIDYTNEVKEVSSNAEIEDNKFVKHKKEKIVNPKETVKKKVQKTRKQRFGYQGNFAIGHLLQQERDQKLDTTDISNDQGGKMTTMVPEINKDETVKTKLMNIPLEVVPKDLEIPQEDITGSYNTRDLCQNLDVLVNEPATSLGTGEIHSGNVKKEPDKVNGGLMREESAGKNIERNLESDSDSVSSTTDSESTDKEPEAIPQVYRRVRKSPENRSRLRSFRDHAKSDSKSEDSGVYSRPSYKEQWRRWYKQYGDWQQQNINMWGFPGMFQDSQHHFASRMNGQCFGFPGWQYPGQSMYYPYQNYHPNYHQSYNPSFHQNYHPSYHQNYDYEYPMYPENSAKLNEQMADAFQFQEEYIKGMSKSRNK